MGSALSDRAIPIQGAYSASKAAVMAITDSLRMELNQDSAPISVTLIKPGAIDKPYKDHAGNYMGVAGKNPPPVYAPETVATAILYAAEHHVRDIVVGAGGKLFTILGDAAPGLADKLMTNLMPALQRGKKPTFGVHTGSLYKPRHDMQERGGYAVTLESSLYSTGELHKSLMLTAAGAAALGYRLLRRLSPGPMPAR